MELICINDIFPQKARELYAEYGVVTPREGVFYSIRDIAKTRHGIGVYLNELINPKNFPVMEGFTMEVSWNINRFKNIDGTDITEEQIMEFLFDKKSKLQTI